MTFNNYGKKKAKDETQSLLPDDLKAANTKIEGKLTQMQICQQSLKKKKEEVGTERDHLGLRNQINKEINQINAIVDELTTLIDEYGRIPVAYTYTKTQKEKQDAFDQRFKDLNTRNTQLIIDTQNRMRQFGELGQKRLDDYDEENQGYPTEGGPAGASTQLLQKQTQLDVEEVKIQGETDYMAQVIDQRNADLKNVEKAMTDINEISKDIKTRVVEQRKDLEVVVDNTEEAKENAKEAEKNIEEAQEHQKKSGKCFYAAVTAIILAIIAVIIIIVLKFV